MNIDEYRKVYELEQEYWYFKTKRNLIINTVKSLVSNIKGICLDVGCGTGLNLKELQAVLSAFGVDSSQEALKFCRERKLNGLINAAADLLPFKEKSFHLIMAVDVLEHVDNDLKVIKEFSRVCKTGGFLIVHVPAFQFLYSDHDVAIGHKKRYSIKELKRKLSESFFEIEYIGFRLFFLFPFGAMQRIFLKLRRKVYKTAKITTHRPKMGKLPNRILQLIVTIEDRLSRFIHFPFGMSIICIARRGPDGQ
jgi:SAM-dependent methyltransferase